VVANPPTPEVMLANVPIANHLAPSGGVLYFADAARDIVRYAEGGSAPELVVEGPATFPIPRGEELFYVAEGRLYHVASLATLPAQGMLVSAEPVPDLLNTGWSQDGTALYFAQPTTGEIRKLPFDGSATTVLATATSPSDVVVAGDWVYYDDYLGFDTAFRRVPRTGGTSEPATAVESDLFSGFTTDGQKLYFAEQSSLWVTPVGSADTQATFISDRDSFAIGFMDYFTMSNGTLYFKHARENLSRVTAAGVCESLVRGFDERFALDGAAVYYHDFLGERLMRIRL
jgi:hypothetical protein